MTNLVVNVATTQVALPVGVTPGQLKISVYRGNGSAYQDQSVDGITATFTDVPPGDYYATAQRLDSTGSNLGTIVQSGVIVIATYEAPSVVTVTLA